MGLFSLDTWKQQWDVVMAAPLLTISLMVLAAVIAWWVRGRITEGQLAARDERLKFAHEQTKHAQSELDKQVGNLEMSVAQGAPHDSLVEALHRVSEALEALRTADRKIVKIVNERMSAKSSISFGVKGSLRDK